MLTPTNTTKTTAERHSPERVIVKVIEPKRRGKKANVPPLLGKRMDLLNLTLQDLADGCDIDRSNLRDNLDRKTSMSLAVALRLLKTLEYDLTNAKQAAEAFKILVEINHLPY